MAIAPEEVAHFIKKPPFFRVFLQPQRLAYRPNGAEQACGKVCAANHKLAARSWVRVQQIVRFF
tara:strand:+ start:320 stop:511 length:192 start_codon:yes stop_codon:yes gene_type:complete